MTAVERATEITREGAKDDAVDHRYVGEDEAHLHVDADAVNDTAENVAPHHVGAEGMRPARRQKHSAVVLMVGIVGRDIGRENAGKHEHADDSDTDPHRHRPAPELPAESIRGAARHRQADPHRCTTRRSTSM